MFYPVIESCQRQRRLVDCFIGEERQRRRHGRRLFSVEFDVRSVSETTLTAVVVSVRHRRLNVVLSRYPRTVWLRQWNTRTAKWKFMRSGTRSQYKSRRSGELRSYFDKIFYASRTFIEILLLLRQFCGWTWSEKVMERRIGPSGLCDDDDDDISQYRQV